MLDADVEGVNESLDTTEVAPDPRICPFLRLEIGGRLIHPVDHADLNHRCVAFDDPKTQSLEQQDLLCLRATHVNCWRYLRGTAVNAPAATPAKRSIPKATVAAIVILLASVGFSFGFVLKRGGIDLGAFAAATVPPSGSTVALAPSSVVPSPVPPSPTLAPSPVATASTSPSPVATSLPTPTVVASPAGTPAPTPRPTPVPGTGTASRYAVLEKCPGRPNCWIYTVRAGDNLFSIAHWFGVQLDTVRRLNPWTGTRGIHAGDRLILPPPTR